MQRIRHHAHIVVPTNKTIGLDEAKISSFPESAVVLPQPQKGLDPVNFVLTYGFCLPLSSLPLIGSGGDATGSRPYRYLRTRAAGDACGQRETCPHFFPWTPDALARLVPTDLVSNEVQPLSASCLAHIACPTVLLCFLK